MIAKPLLTAAAVALVSLTPASAATMQLIITGEVSSIPIELQDPTVALLDPVTVTFTYDDTQAPRDSDPLTSDLISSRFDIGGQTFLTAPGDTVVMIRENFVDFENYVISATTPEFVWRYSFVTIFPPDGAGDLPQDTAGTDLSRLNQLGDPAGLALIDEELLDVLVPTGPSALGTCAFHLSGAPCQIAMTITSVTSGPIAPIPLPAGLPLLLAGLGGLGLIARRRARG